MKRLAITIGCALIAALPVANAVGKDQSPEDQTFVNEASRGGKMEVKLGELAERNSASSEVKEFGPQYVKGQKKVKKRAGFGRHIDRLDCPHRSVGGPESRVYEAIEIVRK